MPSSRRLRCATEERGFGGWKGGCRSRTGSCSGASRESSQARVVGSNLASLTLYLRSQFARGRSRWVGGKIGWARRRSGGRHAGWSCSGAHTRPCRMEGAARDAGERPPPRLAGEGVGPVSCPVRCWEQAMRFRTVRARGEVADPTMLWNERGGVCVQRGRGEAGRPAGGGSREGELASACMGGAPLPHLDWILRGGVCVSVDGRRSPPSPRLDLERGKFASASWGEVVRSHDRWGSRGWAGGWSSHGGRRLRGWRLRQHGRGKAGRPAGGGSREGGRMGGRRGDCEEARGRCEVQKGGREIGTVPRSGGEPDDCPPLLLVGC